MSISQLDKLAAEIGIKADTTPNQARAQILKQLASSSFTPPDTWRCVASKYAGTSPKRIVSEQAQKNMDEKEVSAAIDSFATQYFFLNSEKRRQRWEDLSERAKPFARLRMRMGMLEGGLNLEIPKEYTSEKQEAVIEYVRQLYPLKHADRIKARAEVMDSLPLKRRELEELVKNPSQRSLAKWVDVEVGLFFFPFDEEVDGYKFEDREANYEPEPEPVAPPRPKKKRPIVRKRNNYTDDNRRAPAREGDDSMIVKILGGIGTAVLVLILIVVRVALREASTSSSSSSNSTPSASYNPPNTNFNPPVINPPVTNPSIGGPPVGGNPTRPPVGMGAMGSTISGFGNMGTGIIPQPMFPQPMLPTNPGMGFPTNPGMGFPTNPGMGFPSIPNTGFPSIPNTGTTPGMGFPSIPNTGFPSNPGMGFPSIPNTGFPSNPGTGFPKTGSISGFPSTPGTGIRGR